MFADQIVFPIKYNPLTQCDILHLKPSSLENLCSVASEGFHIFLTCIPVTSNSYLHMTGMQHCLLQLLILITLPA